MSEILLISITRHGGLVLLFLVTSLSDRAVNCSALHEQAEGSGSSANLYGIPGKSSANLKATLTATQTSACTERLKSISVRSRTPPRVLSPGLLLESPAVWLKVVCPLARKPVE